jgi:hypothetical protein
MVLTVMKIRYLLNENTITAMYLKRAWVSLRMEMGRRGVKVRSSEEER